MEAIDSIDLSKKGLTSVDGLFDDPRLLYVSSVDLSRNAIRNILPLKNLSTLKSLNLYYNRIESIDAVLPLTKCKNLKSLDLRLNPICRRPDYRSAILAILPQLEMLDERRVDDREKTVFLGQSIVGSPDSVAPSLRSPDFNHSKLMNDSVDSVLTNASQTKRSLQNTVERLTVAAPDLSERTLSAKIILANGTTSNALLPSQNTPVVLDDSLNKSTARVQPDSLRRDDLTQTRLRTNNLTMSGNNVSNAGFMSDDSVNRTVDNADSTVRQQINVSIPLHASLANSTSSAKQILKNIPNDVSFETRASQSTTGRIASSPYESMLRDSLGHNTTGISNSSKVHNFSDNLYNSRLHGMGNPVLSPQPHRQHTTHFIGTNPTPISILDREQQKAMLKSITESLSQSYVNHTPAPSVTVAPTDAAPLSGNQLTQSTIAQITQIVREQLSQKEENASEGKVNKAEQKIEVDKPITSTIGVPLRSTIFQSTIGSLSTRVSPSQTKVGTSAATVRQFNIAEQRIELARKLAGATPAATSGTLVGFVESGKSGNSTMKKKMQVKKTGLPKKSEINNSVSRTSGKLRGVNLNTTSSSSRHIKEVSVIRAESDDEEVAESSWSSDRNEPEEGGAEFENEDGSGADSTPIRAEADISTESESTYRASQAVYSKQQEPEEEEPLNSSQKLDREILLSSSTKESASVVAETDNEDGEASIESYHSESSEIMRVQYAREQAVLRAAQAAKAAVETVHSLSRELHPSGSVSARHPEHSTVTSPAFRFSKIKRTAVSDVPTSKPRNTKISVSSTPQTTNKTKTGLAVQNTHTRVEKQNVPRRKEFSTTSNAPNPYLHSNSGPVTKGPVMLIAGSNDLQASQRPATSISHLTASAMAAGSSSNSQPQSNNNNNNINNNHRLSTSRLDIFLPSTPASAPIGRTVAPEDPNVVVSLPSPSASSNFTQAQSVVTSSETKNPTTALVPSPSASSNGVAEGSNSSSSAMTEHKQPVPRDSITVMEDEREKWHIFGQVQMELLLMLRGAHAELSAELADKKQELHRLRDERDQANKEAQELRRALEARDRDLAVKESETREAVVAAAEAAALLTAQAQQAQIQLLQQQQQQQQQQLSLGSPAPNNIKEQHSHSKTTDKKGCKDCRRWERMFNELKFRYDELSTLVSSVIAESGIKLESTFGTSNISRINRTMDFGSVDNSFDSSLSEALFTSELQQAVAELQNLDSLKETDSNNNVLPDIPEEQNEHDKSA